MDLDFRVLVFMACMLIRCLSKSTSDHLSESISPRLMPVSKAQMIIGLSLDRFSSQASNSNSSSAAESIRVRLVSSEDEMTVSEPENGCLKIHPSLKAIESILRRTVSSLLTVAMDLCREGASLNFTCVSNRWFLNLSTSPWVIDRSLLEPK